MSARGPSAELYRRGDAWFVAPLYRTTVGYAMTAEPWVLIEDGPGVEAAVAAAVFDAMELSTTKVLPPPDDFDKARAPLLELAGVKSNATFVRGAKNISFRQEGDWIVATPGARERGGFRGLEPETFEASREELEERLPALISRAEA